MKKFLSVLIANAALAVVGLHAMPPLQHLATGVVRAVDAEKHVLMLEPAAPDQPAEFIIEDGRTRLRRDGEPAALNQLSPSRLVRVYYKLEAGRCVAVEVSWKSPDAPASPPSDRRGTAGEGSK
jgi:hypothetical protein